MKTKLKALILVFIAFSCDAQRDKQLSEQSNWELIGDSEWSFENDQITGKSDNTIGFILTKDTFKNFELELDFQPDETINSGIFIRCQSQEPSASVCYEINIWDLNPNQDYRTGGIVNKFSPLAKVNTIGQWNHCKILAQDNSLVVWINDTKVMEATDSDHAQGRLALQSRGKGQIAFKNISITALDN